MSTYKHTFLGTTVELIVNLLTNPLSWGSTVLVTSSQPLPAPRSPFYWAMAHVSPWGSAVWKGGTPSGPGWGHQPLKIWSSECIAQEVIDHLWEMNVRKWHVPDLSRDSWSFVLEDEEMGAMVNDTKGQRQAIFMGVPRKGSNWIRLQVKQWACNHARVFWPNPMR